MGGLSFGLALEMLGQPSPINDAAVEKFVSRLEYTADQIDSFDVRLLPDDEENAAIAEEIRRYAARGGHYKQLADRFGAAISETFYRTQIAQSSTDYLNSIFRSMDCNVARYRKQTKKKATPDGNKQGNDVAERRSSPRSQAARRFSEPGPGSAKAENEQSNNYFFSLMALALVALLAQEYLEKRSAVRHEIAFDTRLLTDTGNYPICIRNISMTGAKLCWHEELEPGSAVVVDLGEDLVRAVAVWNRGGHTGVRFAKKLTRKQIRSIVRSSAETG